MVAAVYRINPVGTQRAAPLHRAKPRQPLHEKTVIRGLCQIMKKIICIIKPFKLASALEALSHFPIEGLLVTEVRGYGRQKGHLDLYAGSEYEIHYLPKVKLEIVVGDRQADEVVVAITGAAATGKIGDGKIFVSPVGRAVRIRTGEQGEEAL